MDPHGRTSGGNLIKRIESTHGWIIHPWGGFPWNLIKRIESLLMLVSLKLGGYVSGNLIKRIESIDALLDRAVQLHRESHKEN